MNDACPDYYKIDHYRDLNHWLAERLRTAKWHRREDAILLNVLYVEMARYVVRLPHKGRNIAEMLHDADKAISLLQDIKDVLAPQHAPEHVTPPAAVVQDGPDTPTGPGSRCASCGTLMPFGGDVWPQCHVCGWTRPRQEAQQS